MTVAVNPAKATNSPTTNPATNCSVIIRVSARVPTVAIDSPNERPPNRSGEIRRSAGIPRFARCHLIFRRGSARATV